MGPLAGVRVIEVAGLGPVPFCGMLLADMGAEVLLVERPGESVTGGARTALERSRRRIVLDLKSAAGRDLLLRLVERSDALFEGYRPGVAERLGFGPDACLERNSRLVYGRVTGWGREGPLAQAAGHDINYLSLSGLLHAVGVPGGKPVPPLNVVGDFGGGGLLLAFGLACALFETRQSGRGQVVDAAMLDGSALFLAPFMAARGNAWGWDERPGASMLAGAAHFYDTYTTADGRHLAVGAIEPQFYASLLGKLGLAGTHFDGAGYPAIDAATRGATWPTLKAELAALFRTRTRDEWLALLGDAEACVTPVLPLSEAQHHPHNVAHGTFVEVAGELQPAPAPRFSRTPAATPAAAPVAGQDTAAVLAELGIDAAGFAALQAAGAFGGFVFPAGSR